MVQSAGKIPIHIHDHHIHFASLSAHKIHGPKGVGALYVKSGTDVIAWMTGGSQERGRRGGTENLIGIVGLGEAARLALLEMNERLERWREYSRECRSLLQSAFGHVIINGEEGSTLPNICSISFPAEHYPIDGEMLTVQCDLSGLSVSSGSACTAGSIIPSHVMKAIGHDDATSVATVRLSFGAQTTIEDVRSGTGILVKVVQEMLERSNPRSHSRIAMP
jgi:cysteine desulfurase